MFITVGQTVYLGLGSNVGDRGQNIARAIAALNEGGVRVVQQSSLYETAPIDVRGNDWFLNAALQTETELKPVDLLRELLTIERKLGRERKPANSEIPAPLKEPRTIDLDILLFGETVIQSPELTIPHPRITQRRFVLIPLAEIAPEAKHPVLKKTIAELLNETADHSQVTRFDATLHPERR